MEQFMQEFLKELKRRTGDKYIIKVKEIVKVNDIVLHSVNFLKESRNISPNIYIEGLYEEYLDGCSLEEIAEKVIFIAESRLSLITDERKIIQQVMDYEKICENIVIKLVNRGMNKEFLKGKIYQPFCDLAVIFYVMVKQDEEGMMSIAVTDEMSKQWGISENVLMKKALENMCEKFPIMIDSLNSVVMDVAEDLSIDLEMEDDEDSVPTDSIYIMTNQAKTNGATAILYKGALRNFASKYEVEEVIIIPSSIHETLLVPKDGSEWIEEEMFLKMLRQINKIEVDPMEVLSNNIYIYNYEKDEISIWNKE